MRANLLRTCQFVLLFAVAVLTVTVETAHAQAPVRNTFMRSRWGFLPPFLENEENLSLYMGHEGNGGPGQESYSRFGATQYTFIPDGVISLNAEGFVTNDGHGGASALLHTRQLIGGALFGIGTSFTVQESELDNIYQQGGVHVEIFPNDIWSLRANGYVPVDDHRAIIADTGAVPQAPIFRGNQIIVPTIQTRTNERALQGYDVELAMKLGDLAAEIYGGAYEFHLREERDALGGKVGIRGYITDRLHAHFTLSRDDRFETQAYGGILWNLGGGAGNAPRTLEDKLLIPVERNHQIVMTQSVEVLNNELTLTDGGAPITVTHVRSGGGGGNMGTFENPFNTNMLPATQGTDIVLVQDGVGPYLNGYTLATGQRLLGGGQSHLVDSDQLGLIEIPSVPGAQPVIQGTIVAANSTEISGLRLTPVGTGIDISGLATPVNINRTSITGGMTGVDINGGSGTVNLTGVTIGGATSAAIDVSGGSTDVLFGSDTTDASMGLFGASTITQNGGGRILDLANHNGDVRLASGSTMASTGGGGLLFENAGGDYSFAGNVQLTNSSSGIQITGGSSGTFDFADADVNGATAPALEIGTAGVANSGGTAVVTLGAGSSINQTQNAPAMQVLGDHLGTLTVAGTVSASNGTGLQFGEAATGANGTYAFNGVTTLAGGDAGIDILGGSAGTFTFADARITNPTGAGINIDGLGAGSRVNLTVTAGTLTHNSAAAVVNVTDHDTGNVTINAGIMATNGSGLQFNGADGVYDFNGSMVLTGGDSGIDVVNSNGTFTFFDPEIQNTAGGAAVRVQGGTANVTLEGADLTTTAGGVGLFVHDTGVVNVEVLSDISTTNGSAVDIANSEVHIQLSSVTVNGAPGASGIMIRGASATSEVLVTGVTEITGPGAHGIDIEDSQGQFEFRNLNISGVAAGHGVRLVNNPNVTDVRLIAGGISGVAQNGIFSDNTSRLTVDGLTITGVTGDGIVFANSVVPALELNVTQTTINAGGRGIFVDQNGAGTLTSTLRRNTVVAGAQALLTNDVANIASQVLTIEENFFSNGGAVPSVEIIGGGANSTIVQSFGGNTANGGGIRFDRVTFDGSGALLAGFTALGSGSTRVGTGGAVQGDGLSFINPSGDLMLGELAVVNQGGTGLEVFTKPLNTSFRLQIGSGTTNGSISTTGGNALFLDPLAGSIGFASVTSQNSVVLGAPADIASSTGDGIFVDEMTRLEGVNNTALQIGTLTVSGSAGHGVNIRNSDGLYNLGTLNISGTGGNAVHLVDNITAGTQVLMSGGTITATAVGQHGIFAQNTSLTASNLVLGNSTAPIRGDGVHLVHTDTQNYFVQLSNLTSEELTEDAMGMMIPDPIDILGRGVNVESAIGATGSLQVSILNSELESVGTALRMSGNGNTTSGALVVSASGNTFRTEPGMLAAPPVLSVDLSGANAANNNDVLRVAAFNGNTVVGNTEGGGIRVERAVFSTSAVGTGTVLGGTLAIGDDMNSTAGNGLALIDVSGSLSFTDLDINTTGGNGLLVQDGGAAESFMLTTEAGNIVAVNGAAVHLESLDANMVLDLAQSSDSATDGVFMQNLTGTLRIADLQASMAAQDGISLLQGAGIGTFAFTADTVAIATVGRHGINVEDTAGSNSTMFTVSAGTVDATTANGLNVRDVDGIGALFTLDGTTFSNIGGFTGSIMNSQLGGDMNIQAMGFSADPGNAANSGSILFNGGADVLQ